jgi:hypothetical protein
VAVLEPGRTSWTTVLDVVPLGPADDATAVTAAQLREVVERPVTASHWLIRLISAGPPIARATPAMARQDGHVTARPHPAGSIAPDGFAGGMTALFEFLGYRATPMAATVPTTANSDSGSGPVLALVPDGSAPPATSGTDHALWVINAANTADIAVTGDNATAEPGDAVTLTIAWASTAALTAGGMLMATDQRSSEAEPYEMNRTVTQHVWE